MVTHRSAASVWKEHCYKTANWNTTSTLSFPVAFNCSTQRNKRMIKLDIEFQFCSLFNNILKHELLTNEWSPEVTFFESRTSQQALHSCASFISQKRRSVQWKHVKVQRYKYTKIVCYSVRKFLTDGQGIRSAIIPPPRPYLVRRFQCCSVRRLFLVKYLKEIVIPIAHST